MNAVERAVGRGRCECEREGCREEVWDLWDMWLNAYVFLIGFVNRCFMKYGVAVKCCSGVKSDG